MSADHAAKARKRQECLRGVKVSPESPSMVGAPSSSRGASMRVSMLMLAGLLTFAAGSALAKETEVTLADQTGVAVTIYNRDLALVRDSRQVNLAKGENDVAFIDV